MLIVDYERGELPRRSLTNALGESVFDARESIAPRHAEVDPHPRRQRAPVQRVAPLRHTVKREDAEACSEVSRDAVRWSSRGVCEALTYDPTAKTSPGRIQVDVARSDGQDDIIGHAIEDVRESCRSWSTPVVAHRGHSVGGNNGMSRGVHGVTWAHDTRRTYDDRTRRASCRMSADAPPDGAATAPTPSGVATPARIALLH
jgi:hypothetical protein